MERSQEIAAEAHPLRGHIEVRGARVHNLKNISVDVPLHRIVAVAGVSGSGKSSLALGVLYAEGSRRYLESLSTYTRRRMTQAARADVDEVRYVPAALALHQRPAVPGIRSTFGTGTELLNSLRLMYSRLASHRCPNGHSVPPSLNVAAERELVCPECGARFFAPGAEELAFNSQGACATCGGTGTVRTVDESTLVPDESLSIDEGAVLPWQTLMWSLMKDIARELGVRTDVPFRELTERERGIVFRGEPVKHHMIYQNKTSGAAGEMDFTYFNAVYTVENALSKVKDEKGMKRVERFLKEGVCPDCGGTRLSAKARAPLVRGISLDKACSMTLSALSEWVSGVPASLPPEMRAMAERICESFHDTARRLLDLGLGYIALDRAASTLSTGERQRMQLARAVRNRTTGVLYVLDEPSIGLHPANIAGLSGVMRDLVSDGNSVLLVDHDAQILGGADWLIELGPGAGAGGGRIIAEGTIAAVCANPASRIAPFLRRASEAVRPQGGLQTTARKESYDFVLRTDRLILRNYTADDAESVFAWAGDARVNTFMLYPCYKTVDDVRDWIAYLKKLPDTAFEFVLERTEDGSVIGGAGIRWHEERGCWTLGYNLAAAYWNNGYATEAVDAMLSFVHLEKGGRIFEAEVALENTASRRVLEKCGFSPYKESSYTKSDGSARFDSVIYRREFVTETDSPPTSTAFTPMPLQDVAHSGTTAFPFGAIRLETGAIHTVRPLAAEIPRGRLTVVTGVSGSGKTTLILESLVPALEAAIAGAKLPAHVKSVSADSIARVKLIDATPIGVNVRSTVATYADIHDELRKIYARTADAKRLGKTAGDFSYNTGSLRCPVCDGTGSISLDVQFLPDVDIPCPDCRGSRYARDAFLILRQKKAAKGAAESAKDATKQSGVSLPALMDMSVDEALSECADLPAVKSRLQTLADLGLGYLTLGEETPSLSGGEAQRLKLASEMGRAQGDSVFVFDEPTIGLHPLDIRTLLGVFRTLIAHGATVIVIEHDLDVIRAADYIIDMGPGGGEDGGRIVAQGTPAEVAANAESITGRFI